MLKSRAIPGAVAYGTGSRAWGGGSADVTRQADMRAMAQAAGDKYGLLTWFFEFHLDTTLPFILLVIAPICWFVRRKSGAANTPAASPSVDAR